MRAPGTSDQDGLTLSRPTSEETHAQKSYLPPLNCTTLNRAHCGSVSFVGLNSLEQLMARKHCTTRIRTRGHVRLNKDTRMVSLECLDGTWRTISERQADFMVEGGEAEKRFSENGDAYWSQIVALASRPTPQLLDDRTLHAVANAKDGRLSPAERRQVEKYQVWALIGDTKAVAVRPRISDAERRQAEKLLGIKAV